jgi:hypothetical protein
VAQVYLDQAQRERDASVLDSRRHNSTKVYGGSQTMASNCLFCRIAAGDIPSSAVYSDDEIYAFRDIISS